MVDGLEVRGRELVVRGLDRCPVMKDYNALCLTCRLETAVDIERHKSDPSPVALCCSFNLSCHFKVDDFVLALPQADPWLADTNEWRNECEHRIKTR